jgi:CheY-like chemotaxis protein
VAVTVDTVALAEPRLVTTCSLPAGEYVRLAVADSGSGIDVKVIDRIFDPFFTTKNVGVGTGLGLSLVHGIVSDLGGGIEVENRPGAGAAFTVYVPRHGDVAPPAPVAEPVGEGGGQTILLVDDETALVRLGEEVMAELGYEPVGFSSSTAALESFRSAPDRFDAVLSDESMPGMTGSQLAREIHRIRPDIPIVLMSGFASAELAARARDAGVIEVLSKPLVASDIARCLANALRR